MNRKTIVACALSMLMMTNVSASNGLYPLPTFDQDWSDTDLAPIDKIIGNASYVGLGESAHATEGFSQAKFRLIKYLVEKKNFRALAMETPWVGSSPATNYIATCQGTATDALTGIFGVWNSQSVADLFSWLCEFNKNHPDDPVKFYGFDIQDFTPSIISDLQNRLSQLVPQQSNELIEGVSTCFGVGLDSTAYGQALDAIASGSKNISDEDNDRCKKGLDDINKTLKMLDPKTIDTQWAEIDFVALQSYQNQLYYANSSNHASTEARDSGMAYELLALHNIYSPSAKTIIWAHNIHLALNHSAITIKDILDPNTNTMGHYLSQSLHSNYAVLALTGYKVELRWGEEMPVPSDDSVEAHLHKTPFLNSILDLNGDFLNSTQPYDLGTETMVPLQQYNGVLYLDTCLPMVSPKGNALSQNPPMMMSRKSI